MRACVHACVHACGARACARLQPTPLLYDLTPLIPRAQARPIDYARAELAQATTLIERLQPSIESTPSTAIDYSRKHPSHARELLNAIQPRAERSQHGAIRRPGHDGPQPIALFQVRQPTVQPAQGKVEGVSWAGACSGRALALVAVHAE